MNEITKNLKELTVGELEDAEKENNQ